MTVQLIVLMGLPWVFEMISSLAPKHIIWLVSIFTDLKNEEVGITLLNAG